MSKSPNRSLFDRLGLTQDTKIPASPDAIVASRWTSLIQEHPKEEDTWLKQLCTTYQATFSTPETLFIDPTRLETNNIQPALPKNHCLLYQSDKQIGLALDHPFYRLPTPSMVKNPNLTGYDLYLIPSYYWPLPTKHPPSNTPPASAHDLMMHLFQKLTAYHASDCHFYRKKTHYDVHIRSNGHLKPLCTFSDTNTIPQFIKLHAHLNTSCDTQPQDGFLTLNPYAFRVSTLPSLYGEDIVLRRLPQQKQWPRLEELGFSNAITQHLHDFTQLKQGLILITGATGSGKTTTLYSLLTQLKKQGHPNIITLEDPIESPLEGVRQSQIEPERGYTFHKGLRALLRQDPDILMIGEIRDQETAQVALDAAYTGHLVLATLHTQSIASTLLRLQSFSLDPFVIAHALKGILAQKLIPRRRPNNVATSDLHQSPTLQAKGHLFYLKNPPVLHDYLKEFNTVLDHGVLIE